MSNQALLVIDMLNDFIQEDGVLSIGDPASRVVENVTREIKQARNKELPIIYICDTHHEDDAEFEMFPRHCVEETKGAEVISEIAPNPADYIIHKRRYSAFFGTDLDLTLRELGVEKLILTGVCTNICVLYTAADARNYGYKVQVIEDAVGSFDEEAHKWALKEMESTLGAQLE